MTATDLAEVCLPHLSSAIDGEAESALRAVNSICGLPMLPSERAVLQQRLLACLASSSELVQRPVMRARVARALLEKSGMNVLKLPQDTGSVMHVCPYSHYPSLLCESFEPFRDALSLATGCCKSLWAHEACDTVWVYGGVHMPACLHVAARIYLSLIHI